MCSEETLRLLLVGKWGAGKSATGNTILGQDLFDVSHGFFSATTTCSLKCTTRNGTTIEIMDSPSLVDTEKTHEEVAADVVEAIACMHPGPTAVLYVNKISRYTKEEVRVYEKLKNLFDPNVTQYMIILFTGGDFLKRSKESIQNFLSSAPEHLRKVLDECGHRYVVFDNMADDKQPQVEQLIEEVRRLREAHGGKPYSCPKYGEVGEKMEKEVARRLQKVEEEEGKRKKYVQELEKKMKEFQEEVEKEKRDFERKEKERKEQMKKNEEERTRQLEEMTQYRQKTELLNQMREMEKERIGKLEDLLQRERRLLELHDKRLEAEREEWRRREEQDQTEILQLKDQIISLSKDQTLRFLLVGKTGSGKSSTGNTIFGEELFDSEFNYDSVTSTCTLRRKERNGMLIEVMDTPGLFDTSRTKKEGAADVVQALACLYPGITAILYVIMVGTRYTEDDTKFYDRLKALLDPRVTQYMIIIFTCGDVMKKKKKTIDELLLQGPEGLLTVLRECDNRHVVFDNMADNKQSQVEQLLEVVHKMSQAHGGKPYTCPKYSEVEEKAVGRYFHEMEAEVMHQIKKTEQWRKEEIKALEDSQQYWHKMEQERMQQTKADMEVWAASVGLAPDTLGILQEEGFTNLSLVRLLTLEEINESFKKTKRLPLVQCLALQQAATQLRTSSSPAMEATPHDHKTQPTVSLIQNQSISVTMNVNMLNGQLQDMEIGKEDQRRGNSILDESDFPSYWKLKEIGPGKNWSRPREKLYTVEDDVASAVAQLVKATWQQQYVGRGKDGVGLSHTGVKVVKVKRLENPGLWNQYNCRREMIYHSHGYTHFRPIAKLLGSSGPVQTTESIPEGSPLCRQIYPFKANEHYLFHGTKQEYLNNIMATGLDSRLTSHETMLGQGIYAAESSTKADQYTDDKNQRTSGEKTMVLVRVVLGFPFINTSSDPDKFRRPPCKKCFKDVCTCPRPSHFDSVIDDAGRNFREFVVYDRSMCYPEYFITYNRV